MRKLLIPVLMLLGSVSAHAYYHDEWVRIGVTPTSCYIVDVYGPAGQTCVRTGLGTSVVTFSSPWNINPFCSVTSETAAGAVSYSANLTQITVSGNLVSTGAPMDARYTIHCTAY